MAELDEEAPFLAVQLEAHVLNGVLVNELERALDRFLPLGELAGGRLDFVPLLSGLRLRLGDVLGAFGVLISVVEVSDGRRRFLLFDRRRSEVFLLSSFI